MSEKRVQTNNNRVFAIIRVAMDTCCARVTIHDVSSINSNVDYQKYVGTNIANSEQQQRGAANKQMVNTA